MEASFFDLRANPRFIPSSALLAAQQCGFYPPPPFVPTPDDKLATARALAQATAPPLPAGPVAAAVAAASVASPFAPTASPPPALLASVIDRVSAPGDPAAPRSTTPLSYTDAPAFPLDRPLFPPDAPRPFFPIPDHVLREALLPGKSLAIPELMSAITALEACPVLDSAAVIHTTVEACKRQARELVADNEAFDSLVAQAVDGIRDDDTASARVQVEATRRLLNDVIHPPPNPLGPVHAQPPWVHVVLGFLHARIAAIGDLEVEALRAVAFHREFALVEHPHSSAAKRARVSSPSTGDKRSVDGSRAPSPVDVLAPLPALTPFPSMVPLAPGSDSSSTPVATPAPLPIPVHMDEREDPTPAPPGPPNHPD